jgi:hypothetical protein
VNIFGRLAYKWRQINWLVREVGRLQVSMERVHQAVGRIESRQAASLNPSSWEGNDFPVYSQWGEDGLLQFLTRHVQVPKKVFIEFGVQDYSEANTRFLAFNDGWSGLLIEANRAEVEKIRRDPIYWQFNLKAVESFITRENINDLFRQNGVEGEIGLLSIDIDGNDYWVWEAIQSVRPAIVIVEYNFRWGAQRAVAVPYKENFVRGEAHSSMIYYGASLAALARLGARKGYALVGCTRAGNDAFFVRRELLKDPIRERSVEEAYVAGQFRESRDAAGNLLFLSAEEEQRILSNLPVIEVS